MPDLDIPHFDLPFRFGLGGSAVCVEQDSVDNVENCVEALFRTEVGQRLEMPEYGIPDQTFTEGGPDPTALATAIDKWEPRAASTLTVTNPDSTDANSFKVTVSDIGDPNNG